MKRAERDKLREKIAELLDVEDDATLAIRASRSMRFGVAALIGIIRDLMTDKIQCRVIVSMHGGTIDSVVHDNEQVEITDVVFLEDPKYVNESGETEHKVLGGKWAGSIIYSHQASTVAGTYGFGMVMMAAESRLEASNDHPPA